MQTTQSDGRTLVRMTDKHDVPIEIEEMRENGLCSLAAGKGDGDPVVIDRHLAARLARQLDAFARTGTLRMDEVDVSTTESRGLREKIAIAQLGPADGATYVHVQRVETYPVGRGWNVVLADGRHLAGVFGAELLGDINEGTQLVLHLRAHNVEIIGSPAYQDTVAGSHVPPDDKTKT